MAKRPYYRPVNQGVGCESFNSFEFEWHPGFSLAQKQRNVESLHQAIRQAIPQAKILEISSKSRLALGVALSAFNLKMKVNGEPCSVESIFQASKVFQNGVGPFPEMYPQNSKEVRARVKSLSAGSFLQAFDCAGERWGLLPRTAFYDYLYLKALKENQDLGDQVLAYDTFTDIEFNPNKSLNCQAAAAALYVSLCRNGSYDEAISTKENFLRVYERGV